jgi:hypothetical protein
MKDTIRMNRSEQERAMVCTAVLSGEVTRQEAAGVLGISERQVRRRLAAYQAAGPGWSMAIVALASGRYDSDAPDTARWCPCDYAAGGHTGWQKPSPSGQAQLLPVSFRQTCPASHSALLVQSPQVESVMRTQAVVSSMAVKQAQSLLPLQAKKLPVRVQVSAPAWHVPWALPQTLGTPLPPQLSPASVQLPQWSTPPQPSPMVPQLSPAGQVVRGVQLHSG